MKSKVYARTLMVMIVMLSSGLVWSADIHVPADYGTIQAAINAANPGDNIIVAAGNYTEQLTINKSLDLIGAGEATTTITAPDVRTGSVTQSAIIHDYLLAAYASAGTIDVRVEGFTFNLNGKNKTAGTGQIDGVFFRDVDDAGGTVAGLFSCTIHNFAATPEYEGFGLVVYGSSDLTLNDNDIHDYTRDGIVVKGISVATVSNNTVTGNATCLNGIDIQYVTSGAVTGNTVTGHTRFSPWAAVGIVVWESSGVTITGNHVDGNFYGIDLEPNTSGVTIADNVLTDNISRAISLNGADDNIVSGNTITGPVGGTDDVAIGLANTSTGNMIGGATPSAGNTITMATSGSANLYAIYMQSNVGPGSNTIRYNTITGGRRAVQFDGPPGIIGTTTVSDNVISGQDFGGICAYNNGSLIITNNTLTNAVRPIEFFGPANITVTGNTINGSTYAGINLGSFTGTADVSDNIIHDIGADNHGIQAQAGGTGLDITGNEIYNISGGGRGIQINGTADGANIDNNEIHDITGFAGICIDGGATGVKINNNDIHDNEQGVVANEPTAEFSGNFIYDNRWGIDVNVTGSITLNNNSVSDNNTNPADSYCLGIKAGTAVANCNWWGTLGFNAANVISVSGGVLTLESWLENGTDADPGTPGFQPEGTNDCGSGTCSSTPMHYNFTITPGTGWATHSETLIMDACAVYKLNLIVGKVYTFKTGCDNGATASFDTKLDLYNAAGALVSSNDDGCEYYRSKLIWTATETSAYVKVSGFNHLFGDFTVAYNYEAPAAGGSCEVPPATPVALAAVTTSWQPQTGTVVAEQCNVYQVAVTNGVVYTFKTGCGDGADANFDTWLELYNSSGTSLAYNDDGCDNGKSILTWTSTITGNVYIKVRGYNDVDAGTYTMKYKSGPSAGGSCDVPPATFVDLNVLPMVWQTAAEAHISSEECVVYRVPNIKTGVIYTFKTGCGDDADADFDTWLELYNDSGTTITYNDDGCENGKSILTWTATYGSGAATDYAYLKVRGYNVVSVGDFTLAYNYSGSKEMLTGVGNQSAGNGINVYPNPADQLFTIASKAPVSFARIIISELTGRSLRTWTLDTPASTYQINSSEFSVGIYVLSIETSEGWIRKKISIVR